MVTRTKNDRGEEVVEFTAMGVLLGRNVGGSGGLMLVAKCDDTERDWSELTVNGTVAVVDSGDSSTHTKYFEEEVEIFASDLCVWQWDESQSELRIIRQLRRFKMDVFTNEELENAAVLNGHFAEFINYIRWDIKESKLFLNKMSIEEGEDKILVMEGVKRLEVDFEYAPALLTANDKIITITAIERGFDVTRTDEKATIG